MKIKFDFAAGLTKGDDGESKSGVYFKLNKYRFELRKKASYEEKSDYSEGELNHKWQDERNGLYKTSFFSLPLSFCVDGYKSEMSYAEATGMGDVSLDWIIDEFDSSFDQLAVATLRYHLNFSVARGFEETRLKYEDLLSRFEKKGNNFTPEELEHMGICRVEYAESNPDAAIFSSRECEVCSKIYESFNKRDDNAKDLRMQLRHDFIDITPSLWS